jgi:hypothetical protein
MIAILPLALLARATPLRAGAPEHRLAAGPNARAETENYLAELKPPDGAKAGVPAVAEVHLAPKGAYHINDQYPYRFKATDPAPDGVTYPKPVLLRADGAFDSKKGTFRLPFVATRAGRVTVGGTLYLSVCSEANCVLDKVALSETVEVKP